MLSDVSFTTRAGQTTAIVGSTGAGKTTLVSLVPRLFDATSGAGAGRRGRRAGDPARGAVGPHRPRAPAAVPVLGHGGQQPAATASPTPPRTRCGRPSRSPRPPTSCAGHARRPGGHHRAGRHQRVRRPAPAPVDRPGPGPQAGDLPVRRLVLGARPHHRRPAPGRPRAPHPGRRGGDRRPAGVDHHRRPTRSWCSRTASWSASAPTRSCWRRARPTPRSSSRRSARGRRHERLDHHHDADADDELENAEIRASSGRRTPGAGPGSLGVPARSPRTSATPSAACSACSAPTGPSLIVVAVVAVVSAVLTVYGPKVLGRGTDVIINGVRPGGDRLRRASTGSCMEAVGLYVARRRCSSW